MRLMPTSTTRLSTARARAGSSGSPHTSLPGKRIAPKPRRRTSRSPRRIVEGETAKLSSFMNARLPPHAFHRDAISRCDGRPAPSSEARSKGSLEHRRYRAQRPPRAPRLLRNCDEVGAANERGGEKVRDRGPCRPVSLLRANLLPIESRGRPMRIVVRTAAKQAALSGCGILALCTAGTIARADQPILLPNSLVISSSTYDRTQGPVASLAVGSTLSGTATATAKAIAGNDYVDVWTNDTVDGSFGITSAIQLTDIEPHSGHVFNTVAVPPDQVVTSFSSKSELGLHVTKDASGISHLVFVAYAGAGVGQIDVSNADAVPGQDLTNPCTFAFGTKHAFARTIVSMDAQGNFAYTPTIDYGGNNGRSALLGSNGLYYAVGNANNGNASTFGPNGTSPDVTETTGLEVVNPINGPSSTVSIPANNSTEVDPLIQYQFG